MIQTWVTLVARKELEVTISWGAKNFHVRKFEMSKSVEHCLNLLAQRSTFSSLGLKTEAAIEMTSLLGFLLSFFGVPTKSNLSLSENPLLVYVGDRGIQFVRFGVPVCQSGDSTLQQLQKSS